MIIIDVRQLKDLFSGLGLFFPILIEMWKNFSYTSLVITIVSKSSGLSPKTAIALKNLQLQELFYKQQK